MPALFDSDTVADSDVVMVGDHGDGGAIVQSHRVLFELLIGSALIGNQPAEQSTPGSAGELLVARPPRAGRYRQSCEAAKRRAGATSTKACAVIPITGKGFCRYSARPGT